MLMLTFGHKTNYSENKTYMFLETTGFTYPVVFLCGISDTWVIARPTRVLCFFGVTNVVSARFH